jgi:hypothetical protein
VKLNNLNVEKRSESLQASMNIFTVYELRFAHVYFGGNILLYLNMATQPKNILTEICSAWFGK